MILVDYILHEQQKMALHLVLSFQSSEEVGEGSQSLFSVVVQPWSWCVKGKGSYSAIRII